MADKELTLGQIAEIVKGELEGPGELRLKGIQSLDGASDEHISFVVDKRYEEAALASRAAALIVPSNWTGPVEKPLVRVGNPYLAYALVASAFSRKDFVARGISPDAHIGEDCSIDENISIYPGAFIGDRVTIGPRCVIYPGVFLGNDVTVGEDCVLYPNVTVYHGCRLGNRVVVHAGTVIGSDGFGYATDGEVHVKIPQIGIVVIEDDVEIGANVAIDRAALGETRIGAGSKLDNLIQIGHNVTIGPNSIIVAQVGVAGSARLGKGVMLGGQVGIVGHITLGDYVRVGAQSGVAQSVPSGQVVSGTPAVPHRLWLRVNSAIKKLPDLLKEVRQLKEKVKKLESGS